MDTSAQVYRQASDVIRALLGLSRIPLSPVSLWAFDYTRPKSSFSLEEEPSSATDSLSRIIKAGGPTLADFDLVSSHVQQTAQVANLSSRWTETKDLNWVEIRKESPRQKGRGGGKNRRTFQPPREEGMKTLQEISRLSTGTSYQAFHHTMQLSNRCFLMKVWSIPTNRDSSLSILTSFCKFRKRDGPR